MQAQRQFTEPDADETADTIVFRPTSKHIRFRKMVGALMIVNLLLGLLITFVSLLIHDLSHFAFFLVISFVTWWFIKQTNEPRPTPIITLSPDCFCIKTELFLGTIPWDEIADVQPSGILGIPIIRIVLKNKAALRKRMGRDGRFLWMYWASGGGLEFSCVPFGMSPVDLAARINRYRERGL